MSYTALYRKFRPSEFSDVKGQDHIVTTLKNQINADRIGHAYLFCGTRGTGKTTVAKIFAKAVNCEHPVDGNPCGECASCRAIAAGTSMNVIEIDAASNNGVDNIREIRDEVAYSPTEGKYKVYIIDEVHMLSIGAFNALLKTLEEPPSYVIFILATTEAHKIPITILSRCQRYDFRRITVETIADRLRELTEKEQVEVEDKALTYIAKAADGSMRDALSLLDQCIAFYLGQKLTYDHVLDVLGAVATDVFGDLFRKICDQKLTDVVRELEQIILQGRELSQFVTDFIWYLRNLLVLKTADDAENMLDMSEDNLKLLREEAEMINGETLMRFIRIFSELSNQIRYASQKRVLIELALIKLTKPQMEPSLDSILQRLDELEDRMDEGVPVNVEMMQQMAAQMGTQGAAGTMMQPAAGAEAAQAPQQVAIPKAQLEDLNLIRQDWGKIIREQGGSIRPSFRDTVLEPSGDSCLCIVFSNSDNYAIGSRPTVLGALEKYIEEQYGKTMYFKARMRNAGERLNTIYVSDEELKNAIHMDITIED